MESSVGVLEGRRRKRGEGQGETTENKGNLNGTEELMEGKYVEGRPPQGEKNSPCDAKKGTRCGTEEREIKS